MIPSSPNFLPIVDRAIRLVPAGIVLPPVPEEKPDLKLRVNVTTGPRLLGESNGDLLATYWMLKTEDGATWVLFEAIEGEWVEQLTGSFPEPVDGVSLTFDQLGRELFTFQTFTGKTYLNWFNPIDSVREDRLLLEGTTSSCCGFDLVYDASRIDSDAMVFYTKDGNGYMLIQRDRFDIPYPLTHQPTVEFIVVDCFMAIDGKFNVQFGERDRSLEGWQPEDTLQGEWKAEHWWDNSIVLVSAIYPLPPISDAASPAFDFEVSMRELVKEFNPASETPVVGYDFDVFMEFSSNSIGHLDTPVTGYDFEVQLISNVHQQGSIEAPLVGYDFEVRMRENVAFAGDLDVPVFGYDFEIKLELVP